MIKANKKYRAEIAWASLVESQKTGTLGIEIGFNTDDGAINHTLWVSEKDTEGGKKNRAMTEGDLVKLGATAKDLKDPAFWTDPGAVLMGHVAEITTYEEEYNEKKRIKVQWINEWKERVAGSDDLTPADRAAMMFGGKASGASAKAAKPSGDDVPF